MFDLFGKRKKHRLESEIRLIKIDVMSHERLIDLLCKRISRLEGKDAETVTREQSIQRTISNARSYAEMKVHVNQDYTTNPYASSMLNGCNLGESRDSSDIQSDASKFTPPAKRKLNQFIDEGIVSFEPAIGDAIVLELKNGRKCHMSMFGTVTWIK